MVMAMQPTKPRKRISIEDIIIEALAADMDVYAFVLEPGYKNINAGDYQKVSARLAAIGVSPLRIFPLDGRQFAIHSANAINSMAQIF